MKRQGIECPRKSEAEGQKAKFDEEPRRAPDAAEDQPDDARFHFSLYTRQTVRVEDEMRLAPMCRGWVKRYK